MHQALIKYGQTDAIVKMNGFATVSYENLKLTASRRNHERLSDPFWVSNSACTDVRPLVVLSTVDLAREARECVIPVDSSCTVCVRCDVSRECGVFVNLALLPAISNRDSPNHARCSAKAR